MRMGWIGASSSVMSSRLRKSKSHLTNSECSRSVLRNYSAALSL